jgi:hypothetical protein
MKTQGEIENAIAEGIGRFELDRHLFQDKTVTSVTANTRKDGEEPLRVAAHSSNAPHQSIPFHRRQSRTSIIET